MRKARFDKKVEKSIMRMLDGSAKKHSLTDVRHAAHKWCTARRDKASLAKTRTELEKRFAEINRKLIS